MLQIRATYEHKLRAFVEKHTMANRGTVGIIPACARSDVEAWNGIGSRDNSPSH